MTESDWWACREPQRMMEFLRGRGTFSQRKARLFAVAVCRRIWRLLPNEGSRQAVEVAERVADGMASAAERIKAHRACGDVTIVVWESMHAANAVALATGEVAPENAAVSAADALGFAARDNAVMRAERETQSALLRDLFFNPFRPSPIIAAGVLAWNNRCVVKLATSIYQEAAFDSFPILGDALEEAGVTDQEVLGHCRQGGAHVRGCWLVDLLMSRE